MRHIKSTKHYALIPIPQLTSSTEGVTRLDQLERNFEAFYLWFDFAASRITGPHRNAW